MNGTTIYNAFIKHIDHVHVVNGLQITTAYTSKTVEHIVFAVVNGLQIMIINTSRHFVEVLERVVNGLQIMIINTPVPSHQEVGDGCEWITNYDH